MGIATKLEGLKFGRLTAVTQSHKTHHGHWIWKCECECGNITLVYATNLIRKLTTSCGCFKKEETSRRAKIHGLSKTKISRIYNGMKQRCYNVNNWKYPDYGGRGIIICERWLGKHGMENFVSDIGERPSPSHSVDRVDVNGNYEPSNCRWATKSEQALNKRTTVIIEHNDLKMTITNWAKYFNASYSVVRQHLEKKTFEQVFDFYKNRNAVKLAS